MAMAAVVPRYTAEEVRNFPDDRLRYEVIRGELFVSPGPGLHHQRAVVFLVTALNDYLRRNSLGEALPGPFEIEFADDTAVQPDVIALVSAWKPRITEKRLYGPPALVVEIISYSSKRTDRLQKRTLYQDEQVPEYWIVDLGLRRLELWRPGAAAPELLIDRVTWTPDASLPPFTLDLVQLFDTATAP